MSATRAYLCSQRVPPMITAALRQPHAEPRLVAVKKLHRSKITAETLLAMKKAADAPAGSSGHSGTR